MSPSARPVTYDASRITSFVHLLTSSPPHLLTSSQTRLLRRHALLPARARLGGLEGRRRFAGGGHAAEEAVAEHGGDFGVGGEAGEVVQLVGVGLEVVE